MASLTGWFLRQTKKEYFWLGVIVVVTLIIHFIIIRYPNEPVFDEQHYVPDARQIIAGQGTRTPEHPSFAKLFIVAGIQIFGDNGLGWRFFSVIAGTGAIILFYLICRRLHLSRRAASLATFVIGFETLTFVTISVAMLDVYTVFMVMLAIWLYVRGSYVLCGLAIALSTLTKITGVMVAPAIILHWLFFRRDKTWEFAGLLAMIPLGILVFMPATDFAVFRSFQNPITRFRNMESQMASLTFITAKHPSMSRPWDWLVQPMMMPYWYLPHYVAVYSYSIWALTGPIFGFIVYRAAWKKDDACRFSLMWIIATYLLWIPSSIITDRVSFIYYLAPSVGAFCVGAGIALDKLVDVWDWNWVYKKQRYAALAVVVIFVIAHLTVFGILYPLDNWWVYPIPPPEPTSTTTSLLTGFRF